MLVWPRPGRDRRVAEDLVVGRLAVGLVELVHVRGDHAGNDLAVAQAGTGENPGRGVGDPEAHVQAGLEEAGVGIADEAVLRPAGRRVGPLVAGDLERIAPAVERIRGRVPVVDELAVGAERGGLGPDVPQDRAGGEEDDVDAGVVGLDGGLALPQRPALVVAQGQQHLVLQQVAGMLLDGQVGGVGDVEAVLLGPPDQRVLQGEEVARAVLRRVGPVIGDHPGPVADRVHVRRAAAQALVIVVAAVEVPGLPGEHVVLDHVGGGAGRVPDRQRHVALPVARAGQLDQVVALDERGRDGEGHRRGPVVTGHHVDAGRDRAAGLVLPRDRG